MIGRRILHPLRERVLGEVMGSWVGELLCAVSYVCICSAERVCNENWPQGVSFKILIPAQEKYVLLLLCFLDFVACTGRLAGS